MVDKSFLSLYDSAISFGLSPLLFGISMSAPASMSSLIIARSFVITARCKAVHPD